MLYYNRILQEIGALTFILYEVAGESYMSELKVRKKGYIPKLIYSLRNLWSAQEVLALRNIRKDHIQYFFAFPLAMIFINIQDFIVDDGRVLFGLAHTTITFLSFALGAIIMFAFSTESNIAVISKITAILTAFGFLSWLLFPYSFFTFAFEIVFMAGIGGCLSSSSFSFVFMLNNTERFFGSTLMLLAIEFVELSSEYIILPELVQKISILFMIAALCLCMFFSKSKDYHRAERKKFAKFDPSIWLVLFIFFSYFAIRITGFYASAFQHTTAVRSWGMLAFILILCCILLHVLFKRSIWTMCNIFFIASILSHLMWYLHFPEAAYLFSELKEVGFLITFYLLGSVTNKFCDFRVHKHLVLICIAMIAVLYLGIDILHMKMSTQSIAVIIASVLFAIFLLLSPYFSQYLFFADWSREFRQINMSPLSQDPFATRTAEQSLTHSLDETNLSPREKQVVALLLQGMTLRQVAPELGLTQSTVATYSRTIYKKLGINSRAELFILFGSSTSVKNSDSSKHK